MDLESDSARSPSPQGLGAYWGDALPPPEYRIDESLGKRLARALLILVAVVVALVGIVCYFGY